MALPHDAAPEYSDKNNSNWEELSVKKIEVIPSTSEKNTSALWDDFAVLVVSSRSRENGDIL